MSKFQIVILLVFGVSIVVAVGFFALYKGSNSQAPNLIVWGDISTYDFSALLSQPTFTQEQSFRVSYIEKSPSTISAEFTEALAQGTGPDLIIISQDRLWKEKPKLLPIPYESISERDFKSVFVEEGEIFLATDGIYGLPISVDPMVLYYNRDLLSSAGIAKPLTYWDEIYAQAQLLSKKDPAGNLTQSVIALGEARNVPNFKDILSLLMLQAGTPITSLIGDALRSQIATRFDLPISPGEASFDFYTQFSNQTKSYYSWNRSLMDAQTNFTSGDSAYYLGFASEFRLLKNKNPTLNFGVALVPQSRVSGKTITYAKVRAAAIPRGAKNPTASLALAKKLSSSEVATQLSQTLLLPPARRDLLSTRPADSVFSVFFDASLQSRGWLDPDPDATKAIFSEGVESITSGRARTSEAVTKVSREVDALIK